MEKIIDELNLDIDALLHAEVIVDGWGADKLRQRELPAFDSKWIEEYRRIKPREIVHEMRMQLDAIRKEVFLEIFRKTNSSEIAGFASDDFELFIAAKLKSMPSNFTVFLQSEYFQGRFPTVF